MKTTKLVDMKIQEGTLCKRGANPLANITLFKSIDEEEARKPMLDKIKANIKNLWKSLNEELPEIDDTANVLKGALTALETVTEDVEKAGKKVSAANMERLKLAMGSIKEIMDQMMQGEMEDGEDEPGMMQGKKPMMPDKDKVKKGVEANMKLEDVMKSLNPEQQTAIAKAIEDAAAALVEKTKTIDVEAITKSIEEKLEKKFKDENEALKKSLDAERDLRLTKEYNDKAASFKNLQVSGALLKKFSGDSEGYAELLKTLEAANAAAEKGEILYKELGGSGADVTGEKDQQLRKSIEEIRKANPGISNYDAMQKAYRENPDLIQ